ncbi:MAG: hypothetical protein JW700_03250 [Candidatus Aenigmarchaeota archaeon]|nr:hypothetical protein [Candidatus Aenigmarchaeota archaeon]
MNSKIIAALVGLMMLSTPVFATGCSGPDCVMPNDGSIDTSFTGSGWNVWFNDMTIVEECPFDSDTLTGDDVIIEDISTMFGEMSVLQNINIEDNRRSPTEVVLNAQIGVTPWMFSNAYVDTYATWDNDGSVFRQATLGDVTNVVSVGASEGTFVDNLAYKDTINVYKSIGLNTYNICDIHTVHSVDTPTCDWCQTD